MKSYSVVACFGTLAAAVSSSAPAPAAMMMPVPQGAMVMDVQPAPAQSPAAGGGKLTEVVVGTVGAGNSTTLSFSPNSVTAAKGDTVRFLVMAGDTSIVQTSLDKPCEPAPGGAKSQVLANIDGKMPPPSFDFVVKDTAATFFSSSDMAACMAGNALAVNPDMKTGGFAAFVQKAAAMNKVAAGPQGIVAAAAPSQSAGGQTLTVSVAGAAAATGGANPSVASGSGQSGSGQSCGCQCLCGVNAFPQNVGQGMFGGFLGEMPSAPTTPQAANAASPAAPAAAMMPPPMKRAAMPPMRRARSFI